MRCKWLRLKEADLAGGNTQHPPSDRASGQHAVQHQDEMLQCGRSQRREQYGRVCIYLFIQYIPFRTLFQNFFFISMSFSSYSTSRCHRSEDIHDVLLLYFFAACLCFFPSHYSLENCLPTCESGICISVHIY